MSEIFNKTVQVKDIVKYTYYDDSHNLVAILDEDKLKEIFDADIVAFNEEYGLKYFE